MKLKNESGRQVSAIFVVAVKLSILLTAACGLSARCAWTNILT